MPQRRHDLADLRELVAQLVRHPLAGRLVLLEALVAERRLAEVEGDRDGVRLHVLDRPQDDVREPEDGVDQLALRRRERRLDEGEVAAVDEPVAVEQHQAGHGGRDPPAGSARPTRGPSVPAGADRKTGPDREPTGPLGRREGRARLAPPCRPDVPRRSRRKEPSPVGRPAPDRDRRARPRRAETPARPAAHLRDEAVARRDDMLVARALEGDLGAFNQLVEAYQDLCHSLVVRLVPDPDQAADAVQEAFFSAYRNLRSYRGPSFRGWLTRIAVNAAMDLQRARKRRPASPYPELEDDSWQPPAGPEADPEAIATATERGRALAAALGAIARRPADRDRPVRRRGLRLRGDRDDDRGLARHGQVADPPRPPRAAGAPRRAHGTVPKLRASGGHAARPAHSPRRGRGPRLADRRARRGRSRRARSSSGPRRSPCVRRVRRPPRRPRRDPRRDDRASRPRPAPRLPALRRRCGAPPPLGLAATPRLARRTGLVRPAARDRPGDARRRRPPPDRGAPRDRRRVPRCSPTPRPPSTAPEDGPTNRTPSASTSSDRWGRRVRPSPLPRRPRPASPARRRRPATRSATTQLPAAQPYAEDATVGDDARPAEPGPPATVVLSLVLLAAGLGLLLARAIALRRTA